MEDNLLDLSNGQPNGSNEHQTDTNETDFNHPYHPSVSNMDDRDSLINVRGEDNPNEDVFDNPIYDNNTPDSEIDSVTDLFLIQANKRRDESKFSLRALHSKLRNHRAGRYMVDFESRARSQGLTVHSVDSAQLEKHRKDVGKQHRQELLDDELRHTRYLKALDQAEEASLKRVKIWHTATERYKEHFDRLKTVRHRHYRKSLNNTFKAASKHFKSVIRKRKKRIKRRYGKLSEIRMSRLNKFKHTLLWRNVPQKIKVHVKFIRGVKDKLPKGRYILLVTLRDRMGGRIVSIKNRGQKRRKVKDENELPQGFFQQTMEIDHDGKFSSLEMEFEQTLFLVSPSQAQRKPYMVFTFELIQVTGPNPGMCCSWASFPVEDSSFNIIEGRYKVPMLRGWLTPDVDQYWKYHKEYTKNLDKWMGNLYFQVKPMPRERLGRVEQQNHVRALKKLSDVVIEDEDMFFQSESSSSEEESTESDVDLESLEEDDVSFDDEDELLSSTNGSFSDLAGATSSDDEGAKERKKEDDEKQSDSSSDSENEEEKNSDSDDSDVASNRSNADEPPNPNLRLNINGINNQGDNSSSRKSSSKASKGKPDALALGALAAQQNIGAVDDASHPDETQSTLTKTSRRSVQGLGGITKKVRDPADLAKYRYSLPQPTGYKESVVTFRKGKYLTKAVLTDMGMTSILTREFWVSVFLFILCFFIRQYLHYFFQYILLLLMDVPSVQYYPNVLYVELGYQSLYLSLFEEIVIITAGMAGNILMFLLFIIGVFIAQKLKINVPAFASKMCVMFGVATFLDPILVLISDSMFQRFKVGDWFKLYVYYDAEASGEGFWGILITMLIYLYLMAIDLFLLYQFILRIFMNGQIIDVFIRVHAPEKAFFMPLDLEVSREELEWGCWKAKRYRGASGAFRRLVVMEYALTDPRDPTFFERSIHIILYTLIPRGNNSFNRRVYRQFLQLENNAIVELFHDADAKVLLSTQMRNINSTNVMNDIEDDAILAGDKSARDDFYDFEDGMSDSAAEDLNVLSGGIEDDDDDEEEGEDLLEQDESEGTEEESIV